MAKKNAYNDYLKQTLGGLIDKLEISDLRKEFLKNRWLDQVMWLEGRATKERNQHFRLRMITIIGGVLVPAMVGFRSNNDDLQVGVATTAFFVSQAVAISAAVEEFFGHGDKYRNYRSTAESMKIEGWQFMQLAGPYRKYKVHSDAYKIFAQRVESYIQKDVEGFVARLEEKQDEEKQDADEAVNNAEKALMRLNQELEERAQKLELEKVRLAEQQVSSQPQGLEDGGYSGSLLDIQMPSSSEGETFEESSPAEPMTGVQSLLSSSNKTSGRRPARQSSSKTITSTSNLPPLGQNALEWEETVDFQALKTILTEQNSVVESQTNGGSGGTAVVSGPQLTTPDEVSQILECPLEDCKVYLPGILAAMKKYDIYDNSVLIGLLATIRIETGGFKPVHEWGGESYWKRYEERADLGNVNPGDGIKYHGRGYIQLTGRANYSTYGKKLGVDLEGNPDLAMDPEISAQVLACYFKERGVATAAREGDWRRVRKLVNGGYHGWDVFSKYVERARAQLA
ncbi:DUF4231 domain-containing protein [Leptolyngbyaceae cyanobacterium CCMR0082]|uniref:DUF4231 domain-containing protein n=1 Tax=Adonisia turfae CCMR0082 TaxID=2304604 RepID=A0A6M0S1T5_9CYAN|nr:DUF4231 domain-containing protein [Adonisia turfae]MDV3353025.1 DUF4231 domain-containing protein [Leptothoe sp. LEGE 181152]NEZ62424.1 DUF4231 domain-containing protein [Adonisia turfae CCMR0082]